MGTDKDRFRYCVLPRSYGKMDDQTIEKDDSNHGDTGFFISGASADGGTLL